MIAGTGVAAHDAHAIWPARSSRRSWRRPVVTGATGPALIPTLRGTGQLALITASLLAVAPVFARRG